MLAMSVREAVLWSMLAKFVSLIVPVCKVGQVENFMVHVFPKIALAGSSFHSMLAKSVRKAV